MKKLLLILLVSLSCVTCWSQQIGLITTTNTLKGGDRFVMTFTNATAGTNQTYTVTVTVLSNLLSGPLFYNNSGSATNPTFYATTTGSNFNGQNLTITNAITNQGTTYLQGTANVS